jgi:hypothetical protein
VRAAAADRGRRRRCCEDAVTDAEEVESQKVGLQRSLVHCRLLYNTRGRIASFVLDGTLDGMGTQGTWE